VCLLDGCGEWEIGMQSLGNSRGVIRLRRVYIVSIKKGGHNRDCDLAL